MTAALRQLLDAAQKEGGSVLTVGSPQDAGRAAGGNRGKRSKPRPCRSCSNPATGRPSYPALIEAADEIFVTADSVAMVADAVMTGKPVGHRADREEPPSDVR